ncbi:hypothetical protein C8T65DRAFT_666650 [Cerioporus squamosus]|nr:hypothetical protein C8T65DRAFT_666650 [Cerioporus squamosus]
MSIMNTIHLSFSVTAIEVEVNGASYVGLFSAPITAILVSRFLLELQEVNQTVVRLDRDDPLHTSRNPYDDTPSFISSLGAFINPDLPALSEDDPESHVGARPDGFEEEEDGDQTRIAAASSSSGV